ncbi:MAG: hypothetical protein U1C74_22565 [Phenylobacterium sp.]|nr:hypothetical protein [Phenylobacterium sp.]
MPVARTRDLKSLVLVIMAAMCVGLGLMCAWLAWAWNIQREEAACWRAAAEFQLQPEGDCRGSEWAKTPPSAFRPAQVE